MPTTRGPRSALPVSGCPSATCHSRANLFGGTLSNAHVAFADGTRTSGLALRPTYSGYGGIGYVGYTVHAGIFWSDTNEALAIGSDDVTVKRATVMLYLGLRL